MSSQSPGLSEPSPRLPLFYGEPVPLSSSLHADWRLKDGDVAFAAETAFMPIVIGELAAAARSYPIVFAAGDVAPIAILGLERDNLFVTDGQWDADAYVPAYVRRYPFGFIQTTNPDGFALAIDVSSGRVIPSGDDGVSLFTGGLPSDLTKQALAFCDAFQGEIAATRAFCDALAATELLIDRRADATLPDGRKLGLEGFQIIDADKFAKLSDEIILDWHRKGWLALAHFHLASLERFSALLSRQGARAAVARSSQDDSGEAQDAAPANSAKSKKV